MRSLKNSVFMLAVCSVAALAQAPNTATLPNAAKVMFKLVSGNITKSAAKMSEESYAFKPTPEVRSFGQILGHVADAQYLFCSVALGEKNPGLNIEKSKTTKADLIQALADALAYCDKAYDSLTDASALEPVKFFGSDRPRVSILDFNSAHMFEHYGNLVTYMRIRGLVPPSSEPRQ